MNLSEKAAEDFEKVCNFVRENRSRDPRLAYFGDLSREGAVELSVHGVLTHFGAGGEKWKLTDHGARLVMNTIADP